MQNETITGPDGKIWTRSTDRTTLTSEDGGRVIGNAEMTTEYLLSVAYFNPEQSADGVQIIPNV